MRCSSGAARLGDDGHGPDGGPDDGNGLLLGCQPWARMSAEVWRRARLPGGGSAVASGWGPGGGGGGGGTPLRVLGDVCEVLAPNEPNGRRVEMDRLDGTGGR